jgi:hypothetical protein
MDQQLPPINMLVVDDSPEIRERDMRRTTTRSDGPTAAQEAA